MRFFKYLAYLVGALVGLFIAVGLFLPSTAHVERSTTINASPETIFNIVNDFSEFNRWSPWAERDPDTEYVFEGPASGVGAKMSWRSDNPDVGKGSQEIIESEPFTLVRVQLDFDDFGRPVSFYRLDANEDGGTLVTWGFDQDYGLNLIFRYIGLMVDDWVGADYESGLANLKTLVESMPPPAPPEPELVLETVDVVPMNIAFVSVSSKIEDAAMQAAFADAYEKIRAFMEENGMQQADAPLAITTTWDEENNLFEFDAAMPIDHTDAQSNDDSEVRIGQTYSGKTLKAVHTGSYEGLFATYDAIDAYIEEHQLEVIGRSWEHYIRDPSETPEEELITYIYFPIK
ncbi:MAG: SRPBCC family protein [Gammaproteobacteria bacterium]|nr:SRPBCC family protein [Gammaproteobacteria bacterium]